MQTITGNAEARLLEVVRALRGDPGANYALHFNLSKLMEENKSDFQLKISINVLNDIFRDVEGSIFLAADGDVIVIYHGEDRMLLEKAIFQLRYLFIDDPIAANEDGSENEDFCTLWDLGFQWRPFHRLCENKVNFVGQEEFQQLDGATSEKPARAVQSLDPEGLIDVIDKLADIDLSLAMRSQPICARSSGMEVKPLFTENYIHIAHLGKLLGLNYNLHSNRDLFSYLTKHLDTHVLDAISGRPNMFLSKPISINLNVQTLLSDHFAGFTKIVKSSAKSIIVEVHVSDVFADMYAFKMAKEFSQSQGYRICIDGLTNMSFSHINRQTLGFDLAKLLWNADMAGDLGTEENQMLAESIKKCGANRMILCRCDSYHALDYGKALGISLFQGRYPDRILNPDAKVIN